MDLSVEVVNPLLVRQSTRCTDAQEQREREYEASLREDLGAEWTLPLGAPEQGLRSDQIEGMASYETSIPQSNRGYQMLLRMGWKGQGLGREQQGRRSPVRGGLERWDRAGGVGRQQEDEKYTAQEGLERKKLAIEVEEDDEARAKRELLHSKETRIKEAVTSMVAVFLCELCNKQYKTVKEHEQHLDSYDHHHKKRLMEMKETLREPREDVQRRELKRAEREMAKYSQMCAAQSQPGPANAGDSVAGVHDVAPKPCLAGLPAQDGRQVIKMGFGAKKQKGGLFGNSKTKKLQAPVAAFKFESAEDESQQELPEKEKVIWKPDQE
mmetsp:Transcript_28124/g.38879  ORF Transcript_28124/g.38879 Transcript_28124/m.38879 type:complete len:325 (+) Transcript_28124:111-1085(+)|eukprot:CAMPEP_0196588972 /NCGR_PEP_ID=MMETSP1081-20130531/62256_1 /TAXON_ID=36882 /ORGANISM="Pyramimonas amylifera, Strain CCMP720" /LENGTH=324 /DNA_ID=CAMNT_0041911629 /DNA_START=104 /DNA_END=1078 /DNA_ORIENTATION=+